MASIPRPVQTLGQKSEMLDLSRGEGTAFLGHGGLAGGQGNWGFILGLGGWGGQDPVSQARWPCPHFPPSLSCLRLSALPASVNLLLTT